jgi:hypothetical protein
MKQVRLIITVGCMAQDGPTQNGTIVETVKRKIYDGNTGCNTEFYVIKLDSGETIERPVQDAFKAEDGILEFRT